MEVKLRQRELLLPKFHLDCWVDSEKWFKQHFRGLPQRWRYQIQDILKVQCSGKHILVHVVNRGESLTSISKKYGVCVYSIAAANKNIVDVDLVFEGQHLNNPFSVPRNTQLCETEKLRIHPSNLLDGPLGSLKLFSSKVNQNMFTIPTSHNLPHAKTTGYFLVLVPLIAFCIRCVLGAFRNRVSGDVRYQTVNQSTENHHSCKSMRWKSALNDLTEQDISGLESKSDSKNPAEEQSQISLEEVSHAYSKLENDYQRFLSECGISNKGYWRGGSTD